MPHVTHNAAVDARHHKARRLARALATCPALAAEPAATVAEVAALLDDGGWQALARLAGQKPPSAETRAACVEILASWAAWR